MAEENKPVEPDKNEKDQATTPNKKEAAQIKPDFQWTTLFDVGANSPALTPAYNIQRSVLIELLPRRKHNYSLPEWHRENKREEDDDLLYLMCGFIHPSEQEMLHYYIARWQGKLIADKMNGNDFSDDDDDERPNHTISVPRATLENYLKDAKQAEWLLDTHENLLLRLNAVRPMVRNLDQALNLEGIRNERGEWESAMDELVGQYEFPDTATAPQDENACWVWMNKMAAPQKKGFWKMDLSTTREELGALNWFRIYKSFADMWNYADSPKCTQRVEGELQEVPLPWVREKIRATLCYLLNMGFLDEDVFASVCAMTREERMEQERILKRSAVAAFMADISKSSPTQEVLIKLMSGFMRYFKPILKKTGNFTFEQISREYKNRNGHDKVSRMVSVSFYNTTEKRNKAVKQTGNPATRIRPQKLPGSDGRAG